MTCVPIVICNYCEDRATRAIYINGRALTRLCPAMDCLADAWDELAQDWEDAPIPRDDVPGLFDLSDYPAL